MKSFSSGESFVVSTSIISSLVAFYNHGTSFSRDFEIIISTFGFSGIIITGIIIFSGKILFFFIGYIL